MIEVYYGEFLINPIPLELSMNYCSHKCAYCFANLNKPDRRLDAPRLMRFLANYKNRNTLAAQLLQQGYPVVISNRTDPFAASNYIQTLPILEVLTALGIPVQFQTKGGKGIDDALQIVGPSVWYITINTLNEAIRKKIEPGAPAVASRFELITQLVERGHRVVVGINPAVPEWSAPVEPLIERITGSGASGVWVECLHLNKNQEANLSAKERAAITEPLLSRAKRRRTHPQDVAFYQTVRKTAAAAGLDVYSVGQPAPSNFFAVYRQVYPKTFPVLQDFINFCYEHGYNRTRPITFNEFSAFMGQQLPAGRQRIAHYLGATARSLWKKWRIPNEMTYRQLLGILWEHPQIKFSPLRQHNFAYAGLKNDDGWVMVVDETEMPYVLFSPWFDDYFVDIREE